jgi:hypothetical protein
VIWLGRRESAGIARVPATAIAGTSRRGGFFSWRIASRVSAGSTPSTAATVSSHPAYWTTARTITSRPASAHPDSAVARTGSAGWTKGIPNDCERIATCELGVAGPSATIPATGGTSAGTASVNSTSSGRSLPVRYASAISPPGTATSLPSAHPGA